MKRIEYCPINEDELSPIARRATDPRLPAAARLMVARGLAPMKPNELVTAQFVLTFDTDREVREVAQRSLACLDEGVALNIAGDRETHPDIAAFLAAR